MKKLSEFKDEKAIEVISELISPIFEIFSNAKNLELKDEQSAAVMFGKFFKNSPKAMMKIFAILSEEDPETYHCNGIEVAKNLVDLVSDKDLLELFISRRQTGDATSSASVSTITEDLKI